MTAGNAQPDDDYLTALVRTHDRPRYYATLFAPASLRADLFAVYGFAAEIARIPDLVSEPMLGEMRLTWWKEALATAAHAPAAGEAPALRATATAVGRHALPLAAFDALIEGWSADLYSDPPATLTDLEGRMGETQSVLFQLGTLICGAGAETANAAGHAGVAYGIARRLAAFASERARGRTIVPADVLAREGTPAPELFALSGGSGVHRAVQALVTSARQHLRDANENVANLPADVRPIFLPLAVVGPLLRRIERLGPAIVATDAHLSNLESLTRIAITHLRGMKTP